MTSILLQGHEAVDAGIQPVKHPLQASVVVGVTVLVKLLNWSL